MKRIGPYTLHTIETGRFRLDGGAMFGVVPKVLWERRIAADERNRIQMNMRCLLIEGEGRLILVDAGAGTKYDSKFADIYAMDHAYADLDRSLHNTGFDRSDITDVILTHLHFDHCGGCTTRKGERLGVTFENAKVHVQRSHWEWANHPNPRERASFLKDNLKPLEESGQLCLLDGDTELFRGVSVMTVNGHTEAQQIVHISGGDRTLVYVADLLPTTTHVPIPWIMAYDIRPLVSMEEKEQFLQNAVESGWDLFFEHDPEVEVASVVLSEGHVETTHHRTLKEL